MWLVQNSTCSVHAHYTRSLVYLGTNSISIFSFVFFSIFQYFFNSIFLALHLSTDRPQQNLDYYGESFFRSFSLTCSVSFLFFLLLLTADAHFNDFNDNSNPKIHDYQYQHIQQHKFPEIHYFACDWHCLSAHELHQLIWVNCDSFFVFCRNRENSRE